jgi:hypothetical protein
MVDVDGWVFRDIVCVVNNYRDFEARSYTDTGTNVRRAFMPDLSTSLISSVV